jgi:hypothetical protein
MHNFMSFGYGLWLGPLVRCAWQWVDYAKSQVLAWFTVALPLSSSSLIKPCLD